MLVGLSMTPCDAGAVPPVYTLGWSWLICLLLLILIGLKLVESLSPAKLVFRKHSRPVSAAENVLQVGYSTEHQFLSSKRYLRSNSEVPSTSATSRVSRRSTRFNSASAATTSRTDRSGSSRHMYSKDISPEGRLRELQRLLNQNAIDKASALDRFVPSVWTSVRKWEPEVEPPVRAISVMTFNLLADILTSDRNTERFKSVPTRFLRWSFRRRLVIQEIKHYMPDVICLQELQGTADGGESNHRAWVNKALRQEGYEMLYLRKTRHDGEQSSGIDLGNAVCWRCSEFTLVKRHYMPLAATLGGLVSDQPAKAFEQWVKHNQVALAAVLRHDQTGKEFAVCTTHITANFKQPWVQLAQVQCLLQELTKVCHSSAKNTPLPLILAGDFNAVPSSAVYELLTTGKVERGREELIVAEEHAQIGMKMPVFDLPAEAPTQVDFAHSLSLSSAYHEVLAAEPEFTNVEGPSSLGRAPFIGTLDYILHTPQLQPLRALCVPSLMSIQKESCGLPSSQFPSDHLPLLATFGFK